MTELEQVYSKKGVNVATLLHWLQLPRQGIESQVAVAVLQEVYQEIQEGKENWKDPKYYSEPYQKKLAEGLFPENFWIDNYILSKCKTAQKGKLFGTSAKDSLSLVNFLGQVARQMGEVQSQVNQLNSMIKPIKSFFTIPGYLKPKTWWRGIKGLFIDG